MEKKPRMRIELSFKLSFWSFAASVLAVLAKCVVLDAGNLVDLGDYLRVVLVYFFFFFG